MDLFLPRYVLIWVVGWEVDGPHPRVRFRHVALSTNRRVLDQSAIDSWQGGLGIAMAGEGGGARRSRSFPSRTWSEGEDPPEEGGWISLRSLVGMSSSDSDISTSQSSHSDEEEHQRRNALRDQGVDFDRYSGSSEEDSDEMMFTGAEFDEEELELGREDLFLALFSYSGHETVLRSIQSNYLPVYLEGPDKNASHLPFLSFEDVAIFPDTKFTIPSSTAILRKIAAPAATAGLPARNLIAVVFYFYGGLRKVGAIVEICLPAGDLNAEPMLVRCRQNFDLSTGQLIKEVGGGLSLPERSVFFVSRAHQVSCIHMPTRLSKQHDLWSMSQSVLANVLDLGLHTVEPPDNATPHSIAHWIASNGPFGYLQQRYLLNLDSCYDRLRTVREMLNTSNTTFQCVSCERPIADHLSMIPLSDIGLVNLKGTIFVNPNSVMHDVILLDELLENAARLEGEPVKEHSWFPGYAWTILRCSSCTRHWGWKFTQVYADKGPQVFWALSRKNFRFSEDLGGEHRDENTLGRVVL